MPSDGSITFSTFLVSLNRSNQKVFSLNSLMRMLNHPQRKSRKRLQRRETLTTLRLKQLLPQDLLLSNKSSNLLKLRITRNPRVIQQLHPLLRLRSQNNRNNSSNKIRQRNQLQRRLRKLRSQRSLRWTSVLVKSSKFARTPTVINSIMKRSTSAMVKLDRSPLVFRSSFLLSSWRTLSVLFFATLNQEPWLVTSAMV